MKSIFTKEDINFMKNNYDIMSYKEIAEQLNFTERQIRGKINGMGLSKIRKFNKDYFKEIKHPNQAYWLGFICADGYVVFNSKNKNHELGIELKDTDVDLLKDFNNELGGVHNIRFRHNFKSFNGYDYETDSCILRIYSKDIVEDLINLSVLPNKTNKKEYPTCNNLFWDFFRGFNDGDGCISIDYKNHIRLQLVNSNVEFLEYLRDTIYSLLNIKGSIYKEKDKKYQLTYFVKNDVEVILNNVYKNKDCQKLLRKYEKYKSFYGSPI